MCELFVFVIIKCIVNLVFIIIVVRYKCIKDFVVVCLVWLIRKDVMEMSKK